MPRKKREKKSEEAAGTEEAATAAEDETDEPAVKPTFTGKVELVPLDKIDFDDTTYRFRASLRIGDLKRSIQENGQQLPIVLRRAKVGAHKFQIVSGFRRTTAIRELGWTEISAIVRDDLDAEGAFRASVLENTARKTYSDIDRAHVIKSYGERGFKQVDIAEVMNLSKRQVKNLKSLLRLPPEVQGSIDDDRSYFGATHALQLKKMMRKQNLLAEQHIQEGVEDPPLEAVEREHAEWMEWITAIDDEQLSVNQLIRRFNEKYKKEKKVGFDTIFNDAATDWDTKTVRLMPVKLEVATLSKAEKKKLKEQLEKLAALL